MAGDIGIQGTLMLVDAGGGNERVLSRFTADDQDPAFLPSGTTLVFDGRSSPRAKPDLYTVTTSGAGFTRLLTNGSQPAPCANGSIVFVRGRDVYLLSSSRHMVKRLTFRGGADPDCTPNSRRVVFIRGSVAYTLGTDGKQLRFAAVAYRGPSYSPDGRWIAHFGSSQYPRGYSYDLDVVDVQGNHQRTVKANVAWTHFSDVDASDYGYVAGTAWRPQR